MHDSTSTCRDSRQHAEEHYLDIQKFYKEHCRPVKFVVIQLNKQKLESLAYDGVLVCFKKTPLFT